MRISDWSSDVCSSDLNWAADLVSEEGAAVAAFLEYLRPQTILGQFGTDGIPGLTSLNFYTPSIIDTGGGEASCVGKGTPQPLTAYDSDRSTLTPLKTATITDRTEHNGRGYGSERVCRYEYGSGAGV